MHFYTFYKFDLCRFWYTVCFCRNCINSQNFIRGKFETFMYILILGCLFFRWEINKILYFNPWVFFLVLVILFFKFFLIFFVILFIYIETLHVWNNCLILLFIRDFPGGAAVKNPPMNARDTRDAGSIPGSGRPPGEGNGYPLQYSCLENSMDRGAWWGYSPCGRKESDMTENTHKLFARYSSIGAFELRCLEKTPEDPLNSKEIKRVNPKGNQPWMFVARTDAEAEAKAPVLWPPDLKSKLIRKDPDTGKDSEQEKKGATGEMAGWHHWLSWHEFEQTLGDSEGQGSLACCSPYYRESDTTQWLINSNNNMLSICLSVG